MNKEEFIGKLQMVYVGDKNAFNEIVEDNQKLKNEVVYSKVEIDRLNNIIDEIKKLCDENTNGIDDDGYDDAYYDRVYVREIEEIIENELKKEKDI